MQAPRFKDSGESPRNRIFVHTKPHNLFALLTEYFLQHKKISIPSIGRFELREHPARLDFGEKLIHPPSYEVVFTQGSASDPALIDYLSNRQHLDRQSAGDKLNAMGETLRSRLADRPLTWAGIGQLSRNRQELVFTPALEYYQPEPVHAEKVVREHEAHTVLVGDREFQKTTEEVVAETSTKTFKPVLLIGFILLLLALAFIGWQLYLAGWDISAARSRWRGL